MQKYILHFIGDSKKTEEPERHAALLGLNSSEMMDYFT